MVNLYLYTLVVLIWGSTWITIRFQLGVVPPEASVAYRFLIAAVFMFAFAMCRRLPLRFTLQSHLFLALQGALIFSTNFFLFYLATAYLTTGLIAVVFSTASVFTMIFNALFLNRRPGRRVLAGATLGIGGICVIFWPEISGISAAPGAANGLLLSVGGTACFSLGSIVSRRNQVAGLSLHGSTAWSMAYGVVLLSLFAMSTGHGFALDPSLAYIGSLLYLSIFGSIVAFASYFTLLSRIGTDRAAYATVLFPVVALTLSTWFEGYHWTGTALFGVLLTLAGNVLVLAQSRTGGE